MMTTGMWRPLSLGRSWLRSDRVDKGTNAARWSATRIIFVFTLFLF